MVHCARTCARDCARLEAPPCARVRAAALMRRPHAPPHQVVVEPEAPPYVPGSVRGHICIFAMRDLEEGEEVTYDYKFPVEAAKITCHCGSPKCLGVMN